MLRVWLLKVGEGLLFIQPLFPVPVYFSVLTGSPPLWLSLIIAVFPLVLRLILTRRLVPRTSFDVPVVLLLAATLIGWIIADDRTVALGGLASTLASAIIYYGLVSNSRSGNRYWAGVGIVIVIISLGLTVWFFSEGTVRLVSFNARVFTWFAWLPKTGGPVLQFNSLGALLSVLVPGLLSLVLFSRARGVRSAAGILMVFYIIALFLSDSGGGWIAAAAGMTFVLYRWRWHTVMATVPILALIAGLCSALYHRVGWIQTTFSTASLFSRFTMWRETCHMLDVSSWFTGMGLGGWAGKYAVSYGGQPVHIHNSYLQTYIDGGLVALGAVFAAILQFTRAGMSILRSSRDGIWHGVSVGLIGGIIAGAVMALYDVTTTVTVWTSADGYIYMSVPFLWVWAALLVVAEAKLNPQFGNCEKTGVRI